MIQEYEQQPVFQRGKAQLLPVFAHAGALGVDAQRTDIQNGLCPPRAAQHAADARDKLPRAEGLGDIVVCAEVQPRHNTVLVPGRTQEDHGRPAALLHSRADGKAVPVAQANIEQHKVKFFRLQQSKRFALTGGLPHGKALTAQKRRQRLIDRAVILHQQDPFHIRASHPVILPLIIPQRHKICKTSQPFDIIRFLSGSFIFRSICAQKID